MSERPRILLVGPLPIDGDVVGGTKVSFAAMVDALEGEASLDVEVYDISRARAGHGALRRTVGEIRVLTGLLAKILAPRNSYAAVVLNTSSGGLLKSGPLVRAACRSRRTPLMIRVFGGDLDLFVDRASRPARRLLERSTLQAERVLLQTHALCERFQSSEDCRRVRWWPTTRDVAAHQSGVANSARRFLFLGQLRAEKGIAEAIEASRRLPPGATLTIVGPEMAGFDIAKHELGEHCEYRGPVPHHEVPAILAEHHVLVFPTYHAGEGMPGIVLEAMQLGLPVVASRWRAIPEIVQDGENGLLVAPRNADGLGAAMQRIAESNVLFQRLQGGARITGERFRARHWEPKLVRWIHELVGEAALDGRRADPERGRTGRTPGAVSAPRNTAGTRSAG